MREYKYKSYTLGKRRKNKLKISEREFCALSRKINDLLARIDRRSGDYFNLTTACEKLRIDYKAFYNLMSTRDMCLKKGPSKIVHAEWRKVEEVP